MGKIKITQKQYQAILRESRVKNLKITREQYNRLLHAGIISENSKNINLIIENIDFNTIKNETSELIKYLYRKTDVLSDFWGKNGLSYDDIVKALLGEKLIIKTGDKYKLNKLHGEPRITIQAIEELLNRIINKNDINKKDSEISEDDSLSADNEFGVDEDKKPMLKVVAYNEEIAILKGPDSALYTFYFGDMDKEGLNNVTDIGGEEVDNYDITKYVNDTLDELTKGEGMTGWEYGDDLVKIDEPLRQELIDVYDKDPKIVEVLSEPIEQSMEEPMEQPLPEMTSAMGGSSGAFTPKLNSTPDDDLITRDIAVVNEVQSTQTTGDYGYDTPGLVGVGRNGEFKKAPKTKAQKTTQYSGGGFVELDSCTKLNNNKSAQNGGCSVGAADNVVKVRKSGGSVISPSLNESTSKKKLKEALKLQHNKANNELIVISDLEGRAASNETFTNKELLKKNGFRWNGNAWVTSADNLEVAKSTLSLANKVEYMIDSLEDLEQAVVDAGGGDSDLKGKIELYIQDLANATDEVALSAEIRRYLTFFAKFHNYSFYNRMLIYIQKPDATKVGSYKRWQETFRQVNKGAKAIKILAPVITKDRKDPEMSPEDDSLLGGMEARDVVNRFRAVNVFDISDTTPMDERGEVPETPQWWGDNEPSETADMLYEAAVKVAETLGVKVTQDTSKKGEKGFSAGNHINLSSDVEGVGRLSTMIHEIGHELMHWKKSSIYYIDNGTGKNGYALGELQAESVSYVVLKHYDLPVKQHPTYLALWKANKELIQKNIKIISDVSQFIIKQLDSVVETK